MAFVCTARRQNWHADVFREGNAYSITVPVGYNVEECKNYFVQIGLEPMPTGEMEYYFFLVDVCGKTNSEYPYWSGRDVARFIGRDDRSAILDVILNATVSLLEQARPATVYRCTHDEDPPESALEKHYLISKVFRDCGYDVTIGSDYHGKRIWEARRL